MNKADFKHIYSEYEISVYNYIWRMVKDTQTAEDLTQDAFIKIYQNLVNFRGDSSLSTWIFKIATNTYLDYFRSASHKKSAITDDLNDEQNDEWKSEEIDRLLSIDEQYVKSEMNDCIRGFLNNLPDDYRAVIVLHDLQGLKNKEVAQILDTSLDNVKIRLHRARRKFQTVLSENCSFYQNSENVFSCVRKEN